MICLLAVLFSIIPLPLLKIFYEPQLKIGHNCELYIFVRDHFCLLTKSRTSETFTVMATYVLSLHFFRLDVKSEICLGYLVTDGSLDL